MRFRLGTKLRFAVVIAAMTTMVVASRAETESVDDLLRELNRARDDTALIVWYELTLEDCKSDATKVLLSSPPCRRRFWRLENTPEQVRIRALRQLAFPPIPPH